MPESFQTTLLDSLAAPPKLSTTSGLVVVEGLFSSTTSSGPIVPENEPPDFYAVTLAQVKSLISQSSGRSLKIGHQNPSWVLAASKARASLKLIASVKH